jgi:hypothetical protein
MSKRPVRKESLEEQSALVRSAVDQPQPLSDEQMDEVQLPVETSGDCIRWKRCGSFRTTLANGYCMDCWDKGFDIRGERLID